MKEHTMPETTCAPLPGFNPHRPSRAPDERERETLRAALAHYVDLLESPTGADRAALGDAWADAEIAHCRALQSKLAD